MKFAKVIFWIAGIYGVVAFVPLYFAFNLIGRMDPPPINHPGFYYGFAGVGLAWQIGFCVIATNPVRLRPLMLPAVLEKFSFGIATVVLYFQQRAHASDLGLACIDLLFGVLFLIAFAKTAPAAS